MNQALHNVLQENEGPKSAERIGDGAIMSDANNVTGGISDGRSAAYARCQFPVGAVSANSCHLLRFLPDMTQGFTNPGSIALSIVR